MVPTNLGPELIWATDSFKKFDHLFRVHWLSLEIEHFFAAWSVKGFAKFRWYQCKLLTHRHSGRCPIVHPGSSSPTSKSLSPSEVTLQLRCKHAKCWVCWVTVTVTQIKSRLSPRSRNSTHRHSLSGPSPMKMKATWPKNAKDMYPGSPWTAS
jgi:hypothetical protein